MNRRNPATSCARKPWMARPQPHAELRGSPLPSFSHRARQVGRPWPISNFRTSTAAMTATSRCHDNRVAKAHMESNGGSFNTSQQAIDDGDVVEMVMWWSSASCAKAVAGQRM